MRVLAPVDTPGCLELLSLVLSASKTRKHLLSGWSTSSHSLAIAMRLFTTLDTSSQVIAELQIVFNGAFPAKFPSPSQKQPDWLKLKAQSGQGPKTDLSKCQQRCGHRSWGGVWTKSLV